MVRPVKVTDELRALRERSGLSMAQVAKRLGYKGSSSYQRYEDATLFKKPYLPADLVEKLIPVFEGRGSPPIDSLEVLRLAGLSKVANKAAPNGIIVSVAGKKTIPDLVPILEWEQIIMWLNGQLRQEQISKYADAGINTGQKAFLVHVTSNSMEPEFRQGDRIMVDPDVPYQPGDIVMALDQGGKPFIGIYRLIARPEGEAGIEITPRNPNWPAVILSGENARVIGRVVEHRRNT
jgi:SOS-response transcriptional repressor LexA